jgi:hypothetical protein
MAASRRQVGVPAPDHSFEPPARPPRLRRSGRPAAQFQRCGDKMNHRMRSGPTWASFPVDARLAWMELSPDEQDAILEAAWCSTCLGSRPFDLVGGRLVDAGLSLTGRCRSCGGEVGRLVEG